MSIGFFATLLMIVVSVGLPPVVFGLADAGAAVGKKSSVLGSGPSGAGGGWGWEIPAARVQARRPLGRGCTKRVEGGQVFCALAGFFAGEGGRKLAINSSSVAQPIR